MNNSVALPVRNTADRLARSHVFVAVAAFLLTLQTGWYGGGLHPLSPVALFAFASALAAYNMPFVSLSPHGIHLGQEGQGSARLHLFLAAFAGCILSFSAMPTVTAWPAAAAAALTLGYVMPFRIHGKRIRSLRHLPFLKSAVLAVAWTLVTAWLPLLAWPAVHPQAGWILAERFFFIFALCIAFDIRDVRPDRQGGLKTIPVVFGVRAARTVLLVSLVIFFLCGWQHSPSLVEGLLPFLLTAVITAGLALFGQRAGQNRYSLMMDSTMIVQFVLIIGLGN
jgi:4-hydroxybenzoate polyprenyltransferase